MGWIRLIVPRLVRCAKSGASLAGNAPEAPRFPRKVTVTF